MPSILWVHGWGMSPNIWPHAIGADIAEPIGQPEALLPGWRHSYFTYEGCSTGEQMVRHLHSRLSEEKPDAVVGWSLGGMLLLRCLADELRSGRQLPMGVRGRMPLVILAGSTLSFIHPDRNCGWPRRIVERMRAKAEAEPWAVGDQFASAMLTGRMHETRLVDQVKASWGATDFSREGLYAGLSYLIEEDLRTAWLEILTPALKSGVLHLLWLQGEEDGICPIGAVPDTGEGWQKAVFPCTGHLPFLERTPEFYQRIKEFLHEYLEYR
ncbi:alpha/beta fold hydrolase [Paenibacillus mucilaginosus]|uniref:alpha/beta fold hydrolase n=1 Tax=Paenibacillus mucilaginosus TaxID=61624 RepID=UPI003D1EB6F2